MSAPVKQVPSVPTTEDPFRLGWRWVRQRGPDGTETFERVPLRPEDLLHPEEDDFLVTNDAHDRVCTYLRNAFEAHLAGQPCD